MALPMRHWEILAGKCVPAFCVGLFNGMLYVVMIPLVSDVPFNGSLLPMFLGISAFSLAITGIGLAISTVSHNQQQAFLGGFLVIVPLMLLSGYASPVDGMPHWLQLVAAIDPLSHMLTISHGLFLKGLPAEAIMPQILPILAVAVAALAVALGLMRLRHD